MHTNLPKVYRKKIIKGVSIPGIIHNGTYFFADLDIYEDGRVSCWNFEDFDHFKHDVYRGWVSVEIPDEKAISIYSLGEWKISQGNWMYDKETFIQYVYSIIEHLNPKLENLYKHSIKKVNGITISELGRGNIYKEQQRHPNDYNPNKIVGKGKNIFYKIKDQEYYLARLDLYDEDSIIVSRIPQSYEITLSQLETLMNEEEILTDIPIHSKVNIDGFGSFEILEKSYVVEVSEKLLEIKDSLRVLKGEPSSVDICRNILEQYRQNPTEKLKEKLRIAYENIPEHEQMFVGDMDTKDTEVRMIIYGKEEIENWSHYQVAKNLGEELPSIDIPKPKKEK